MTDAYDSVEAYVSHVAPHLQDRLRRWDGDGDLLLRIGWTSRLRKAWSARCFCLRAAR